MRSSLAYDLLLYEPMRPVLLLFVIAATGFGFILQKEDTLERSASKAKPAVTNHMGERNWVKHCLDKTGSVAQNVPKRR